MHDPGRQYVLKPSVLRHALLIVACAMLVIFALQLPAQTPSASLAVPDDGPPDPAYVQVPEDPNLPRVLIMGDSISMGYTWEVRKLLAGKANVQHPTVNCGPSQFGAEHVAQFLGEKSWQVIYFNFGLHDIKYLNDKGDYVTPDKGKQVASVEQYKTNLRSIIVALRRTGARLIFATTTPVPTGATGRVPGDEVRYNAAAREIMQESGIEIDDLWSLVKPSLQTLQQPQNVHFNAEGYRILGAEAASRIERDLPAAKQN
jgi:acyl-CoA thioesterase-1